MLAITDLAAEAIKTLTTDAELPDGGGLRIAAPDPQEGLELTLAGQPAQNDVVLSGDGVSVFLEPGAAEVLDDKVLDVQRRHRGRRPGAALRDRAPQPVG